MGQLEKYGLYVLCLLIFLILGVTLWGSGTVNAQLDGQKPAGQHLKAVPRGGPEDSAGTRSAKLPNFRELLTPAPAPRKTPPPSGPKPGPKPESKPENGSAGAEKPAPPAAEPAVRPTYKIQRGDNYESIAREQFGQRSLAAEIARLNPRLDPRKLLPGNEILMPTQAEVDAFVARRVGAKTGLQVGGRYTIVRGDTLIGIAKRKLGSEKRLADIQALNPGVDPANLRIGTTIRLPAR